MDVTPSYAVVFRSVLSGVGGCTGGWRCCWEAPSLPQLPPVTPKNPPPYNCLLFLCFCSDESNQHKPGRLEINLSLSEKQGGKSHLGTTIFFKEFSCFRNLEMSHGHPFVAAYIYGDNA